MENEIMAYTFHIDMDEMKEYVISNSNHIVYDRLFYQIEREFRMLWNNSTGRFLCEDDFVSIVYDVVSNEDFYSFDFVEDVVRLLVKYIVEIHWVTRFSNN
jgi:hypothetical protein